MTRDEGGKLVRETWVQYVLETCDDPKPSHIVPWGDMLSEWDKEADRRIYDAVVATMTNSSAGAEPESTTSGPRPSVQPSKAGRTGGSIPPTGDSLCPVCKWPFASEAKFGCVPGNCADRDGR